MKIIAIIIQNLTSTVLPSYGYVSMMQNEWQTLEQSHLGLDLNGCLDLSVPKLRSFYGNFYFHFSLTELEVARDDLLLELHKQPKQSPTDNNVSSFNCDIKHEFHNETTSTRIP